MFTERIEIEEILKEKCKKILFKNDITEKISDNIYDRHRFPTGKMTEIITQKISLEEVSDEILFFLSEELIPENIEMYFTPKEIKIYKDLKYENPHTIKYPIELRMIQVAQDQWIGSTTVGFFIGLGMEDKIKYNPKTQRIMKQYKKRNESVNIWKPTVSQKSVNEIVQEFKSGEFISNTITLNFTDESELDYVFDSKNGIFAINSLSHFDITDGYHRYLAMNRMYSLDENFDFPMEIRITNFDEAKAQYWIYQEDQKTKMRKIDSNSLNQNSNANQIVESLNSFGSVLQGKINRNAGIVSYAVLADAINKYYYGKEIPLQEKNDKGYRSMVVKDLKDKFRLLNDIDNNFLNKQVENHIIELLIYDFCFMKDYNMLENTLTYIINNEDFLTELRIEKFKGKNIKKYIEQVNLFAEEVYHV